MSDKIVSIFGHKLKTDEDNKKEQTKNKEKQDRKRVNEQILRNLKLGKYGRG